MEHGATRRHRTRIFLLTIGQEHDPLGRDPCLDQAVICLLDALDGVRKVDPVVVAGEFEGLGERRGVDRYAFGWCGGVQVPHDLAQNGEVWTLDISGEEWGEVDFPEDVGPAEEMVAGW